MYIYIYAIHTYKACKYINSIYFFGSVLNVDWWYGSLLLMWMCRENCWHFRRHDNLFFPALYNYSSLPDSPIPCPLLPFFIPVRIPFTSCPSVSSLPHVDTFTQFPITPPHRKHSLLTSFPVSPYTCSLHSNPTLLSLTFISHVVFPHPSYFKLPYGLLFPFLSVFPRISSFVPLLPFNTLSSHVSPYFSYYTYIYSVSPWTSFLSLSYLLSFLPPKLHHPSLLLANCVACGG